MTQHPNPPLGGDEAKVDGELGCLDCAASICSECDPCADPAAGLWKEPLTIKGDA